MLRRLVVLVLLGVVGLLAAAWLVGSIKSAPSPSRVPPASVTSQSISLITPDKIRIAATHWPGKEPGGAAILLLHGNDASRAAMFPAGEWLNQLGYEVLAIDFRGHGESAAAPHSFGYFDARDASAAVEWLKSRGSGRVGVIGSSLGGAASLIGEQGPLDVDAMVLQAVYPDIRSAIFNRISSRAGRAPATLLEPLLSYQSRIRIGVWPERLAPIDAIKLYHGAVMVIGGEKDTSTPLNETRLLFEASAAPHALWIAPGRGHGDIVAASENDWKAKVKAFLDVNLPVRSH